MTAPALAVEPLAAPPDVTVRVPGSKSITNRALAAAAVAAGPSVLDGALVADDTLAMVGCLRRLGVGVEVDEARARMDVSGTEGIVAEDPADLDARQSGTTARFLLPFLAAGPGPCRLDGAPQLRRRPMGPAIEAVRALGAVVVEEGEPGHLPVTVTGPGDGGRVLVSGDVSSQFLSGLLLAGPCFRGGVTVEVTTALVSAPFVELTLAVMAAFGVDVEVAGGRWSVGPGVYRPARYAVEPDATAASYFFAAAAITGGRVRVEGLGRRALQGDLGFVDLLERMGARVTRGDDATEVEGTGTLTGITADLSALTDTAQTLAAVAVFADSPTRVTGIGFIRAKETDRIAAVVRELNRCGIDATEDPDGFTVVPGRPRPARIETYDDHRMAMSFALLGLRVPGIEITDPGCVAKTYPGFFADLDQLRGGGAS
ncbi:MAG TPA: 3-phosphoshikimate 1-carboxyvinyltransferase [Acidimicrobiales bacterium]|nr:3-phosphoshikimate 1-carboxyvinyltransferase [Acidimicrobiales bacterium]